MVEMGLLTVALCTLSSCKDVVPVYNIEWAIYIQFNSSSSISAPKQKFSKKMTRMLRFIVLDVPVQNSSFHDTWLC